MQPGQFVWNDLVSPNPSAAQRFYQELFGWQAGIVSGHTVLLTAPEHGSTPVGAVEPGDWPHWRPFIDVASLEKHLERAAKAGGRVARGAAPHPSGRYAVLSDPSGGIYAALELEAPHPPIHVMTGRVVWHQLMTTDLDKALAYYQTVFGWERHGPPGWHAFVGAGVSDVGVISQEPEPRGSTWIGYIQVDDVTGTTERAIALGATVVFPALEVPPLGKLAVLLDPSAVSFGVINRTVGSAQG
jgi:predicted enzyme related to lactoylglutathione lyase